MLAPSACSARSRLTLSLPMTGMLGFFHQRANSPLSLFPFGTAPSAPFPRGADESRANEGSVLGASKGLNDRCELVSPPRGRLERFKTSEHETLQEPPRFFELSLFLSSKDTSQPPCSSSSRGSEQETRSRSRGTRWLGRERGEAGGRMRGSGRELPERMTSNARAIFVPRSARGGHPSTRFVAASLLSSVGFSSRSKMGIAGVVAIRRSKAESGHRNGPALEAPKANDRSHAVLSTRSRVGCVS